ncbi:polysaccharide deacetylase family protein [Gymnodinialimonas ceratoperidinii]|uniref:Chitooligosaccharide deacetylase n=1 Tax=Gymnodinialimonas ceratoperidinii TaxID=2856823 RepID=A0A8F6YDJ9_9RHOB|nr:polysaccharide deacetylase family protein [Gymnodinialimonas ceratoperidinii]QXT40267.1 polysaccharide deacetylase family protein [Gymnodinialimonas ceratoperidinii]
MSRPRDLAGYGAHPPDIRWPNGAGLAVNFVLNVEEGSEYSVGDGDGRSESALCEVRASRVPVGDRDLAAESMYEYGSRVGFWRIHDLFRSREVPLTIFAAALALERTPDIAAAIAATDWDICAHGYRWIEAYHLTPKAEAKQIAMAHESLLKTVGRAPKGFYCRYSASAVTRGLVASHGGFSYDSDAYNDDLPYWTVANGNPHLVVPYTMVTNDAKFLSGDVFSGREFGDFLIDSFDVLRAEAQVTPRMMSIGLHSRIIGHPGRLAGLIRFMDHLAEHDDVWVCGRDQIAAFWHENVPPGKIV